MNCLDGEKYLQTSLKSIINQTHKKWELIFWDNCSQDKSAKILKNFKDKRIKYFKATKCENLYKARNLAVSKATGKYICFLDTDDKWKKSFLKEHLKKIEEKNCDFIFSKYYIKNQTKKTFTINEFYLLPSGFLTQYLLKKYRIGIIAVFFKKKIFKKFKFDDSYQIIGDFDFFLKLSLYYKFYPIQKAYSTYRYHASNFTSRNTKLYIIEYQKWLKKNKKIYEKKYNLNYIKINIFKLKLKHCLQVLFRSKILS